MRIAITGVGVNSALGVGWDENRSALLARRCGIGPVRFLPTTHTELPVGEVPMSSQAIAERLGLKTSEPLPRTTLLGRLALEEAVASAGLTPSDFLASAFLSGTTVGGMDITEQGLRPVVEAGQHLDMLARHDCGFATAQTCDCATTAAPDGYAFKWLTTVSTACSSAANALLLGIRLLRSGAYQRVVAGGAESLSLFHLNGFNALMILDHAPCRPFAADRAGLNLGEGAAYLVLEPEDVARQRGAHIYGFLDGAGNACDAFHQTATSDDGEGPFRAMTEAIRSAGLQPSDVDYVNAHGTGTPNNDATELAALHRVFGSQLPPFSSTKGLTGHTTSASGSIEAAFCLMALNAGFLPNLPEAGEAPLRHVLCNAFGFGGNDTALLLSAPDSTVPTHEEVSVPPRGVYLRSAVSLSPDDEVDFRQYMSAGEARRLGKMLKRTLASAKMALTEAGLQQPQAILTGTALGSVESTEQLIRTLATEGEQMFSPTHFMLSTHNTLASLVAIALGAHGYNTTYSHRSHSFPSALYDAYLQLSNGLISNALVGAHDALPGHEVSVEAVVQTSPAEVEIADVRLFCHPSSGEVDGAVRRLLSDWPDLQVRTYDVTGADAAQPAVRMVETARSMTFGQKIALVLRDTESQAATVIVLIKSATASEAPRA